MSKKPIIVFEGIEGSGKSHHISIVSKYLDKKKINYIKIREPGGNPNSEKIRKNLAIHQRRRRVKPFFDTSRAQMSQGEPAQAKLSRAELTGIDRPALHTLRPDRPPLAACTGSR